MHCWPTSQCAVGFLSVTCTFSGSVSGCKFRKGQENHQHTKFGARPNRLQHSSHLRCIYLYFRIVQFWQHEILQRRRVFNPYIRPQYQSFNPYIRPQYQASSRKHLESHVMLAKSNHSVKANPRIPEPKAPTPHSDHRKPTVT